MPRLNEVSTEVKVFDGETTIEATDDFGSIFIDEPAAGGISKGQTLATLEVRGNGIAVNVHLDGYDLEDLIAAIENIESKDK